MPQEYENGGRFQPGWRGGPGRPKGSAARPRADLSQLIMDAATETGFSELQRFGEVLAGVRGHRRCAWYPHCEAGHAAA
jgi:hypothetical protein